MNSSNTALQAGHHHHHHQPSSTTSNQHFHHTNPTPLHPKQPAVVNPNPSIHRFQSLNENPWQLQSQIQQPAPGPIPPLRQHKRPAPTPPAATAITSLTTSLTKPTLQPLSTYNQPVYLTSSAQTQTTPGLAPQSVLHSQHSPKSPNQNFLHQPGNLMSTSLNSGNIASSMVNNHHLTSSQTSASHHTTNLSNNNNNTNFDDLNLNGTSSITTSASHHKKLEMKHNTMP